jgi:hypothetical protein
MTVAYRDPVSTRRRSGINAFRWALRIEPIIVSGPQRSERDIPTGTVALAEVAPGGEGGGMISRRCGPVPVVPSSAFKGFRFPAEIIVLALRWYLRFGLSYRDVEELLA